MSSNSQRPDHSGRAACARLGASASCLVVILAANQAAARDAPSPLPYLAQSSPMALRFAAARAATAPPPHLQKKAPEPAPSSAETNAAAPANVPATTTAPAAPAAPGSSTPSNSPPTSAEPGSGLPILPDTYARPAPVTVDDLLPYFLPAPPPVSRATYEIK